MSENSRFDTNKLATALGLIALCLFALNFHTYLSRAWDHSSPRCERDLAWHDHMPPPPPVPPLPPMPPIPAIAPMPDMEHVIDIDVDLSDLEMEMRQLEHEMREMEMEVHAEAVHEAARTLRENAHAFKFRLQTGADDARVIVVN